MQKWAEREEEAVATAAIVAGGGLQGSPVARGGVSAHEVGEKERGNERGGRGGYWE